MSDVLRSEGAAPVHPVAGATAVAPPADPILETPPTPATIPSPSSPVPPSVDPNLAPTLERPTVGWPTEGEPTRRSFVMMGRGPRKGQASLTNKKDKPPPSPASVMCLGP